MADELAKARALAKPLMINLKGIPNLPMIPLWINIGPLDHNIHARSSSITDVYGLNQNLLLSHFQPLSLFQLGQDNFSFVIWSATKDWLNFNHTVFPTSNLLLHRVVP
ncbi:hypothetical protein RCL_jg21187.t1 [Rhizophagus clarus]|uniref:Uncharacterized protein n=1 Tax=Rhizophagus clarus TaxID=94130 RepID=A0A8H3LWV7_9GLOM|nr:hypothetical protein RCL_jg21187.t1 [Rhizophagus clarus]